MKIFIATFLLINATLLHADCGIFNLIAKVEFKNNLPVLIVNPRSQSQIVLSVKPHDWSKLSPYIDLMIATKVRIEKEMEITRGEVAEIIGEVKRVVPEPLRAGEGTKLELETKLACKKVR